MRFLFQLAVGIPLGIVSALNRNKILDHATRLLVLLFASFPGFWVAIILILFFSIGLGVLPTSGMSNPQSIILPAFTLSIRQYRLNNTHDENLYARCFRAGLYD